MVISSFFLCFSFSFLVLSLDLDLNLDLFCVWCLMWYYSGQTLGICRDLRCKRSTAGWCVLRATTLSIVVICLQVYVCPLSSLGCAIVVFFFYLCCFLVFYFLFYVEFLFLCFLFFSVFCLFGWFFIYVFRINDSLSKGVEVYLVLIINQTGSIKDNKKVKLWSRTTERSERNRTNLAIALSTRSGDLQKKCSFYKNDLSYTFP